jgi:hypothetical protein
MMEYEIMDRETELGKLSLGRGFDSVTASGTWVCKGCDRRETMILFGMVESDDGCFVILTDHLKDHYNEKHNK